MYTIDGSDHWAVLSSWWVRGLVGQTWPSLDIISTAFNCSHDTESEYIWLWFMSSYTLLIKCLSVSSLLVCQSTLCLHLPQCSELTCCCLIILCYAKLFSKKNLLLTMYYKENFMWNSIISQFSIEKIEPYVIKWFIAIHLTVVTIIIKVINNKITELRTILQRESQNS
jgi:hypothetical protein